MLLVHCSLIMSILTLILAREMMQPYGFILLIFLSCASIAAATAQAVGLVCAIYLRVEISSSLRAFLLSFILYCFLVFLVTCKSELLGFDIFFVPTASMYPAIRPGQYILVDTWAYHDAQPNYGDVVVLKSSDNENWMVKRVSNWPNGKVLSGNRWFLLGDNKTHSLDSRNFGGVSSQNFIGKVRLIIAEIDPNQPMGWRVNLTPIK